jgi:hypothetical protein
MSNGITRWYESNYRLLMLLAMLLELALLLIMTYFDWQILVKLH